MTPGDTLWAPVPWLILMSERRSDYTEEAIVQNEHGELRICRVHYPIERGDLGPIVVFEECMERARGRKTWFFPSSPVIGLL